MSLRITINKHLWSSCLIQLKIDTQAVKTKGIFFRKWIYIRIFSQIDYGCTTIKKIPHFLHKNKIENNEVHCHHSLCTMTNTNTVCLKNKLSNVQKFTEQKQKLL